MIRLGEKQKLYVVKKVDFGVYLASDIQETQEKVLLPKKQVPEGVEVGSTIEVFLYKDSKDRLIATTKEPKLKIGETALLRVAQTNKIGAFLDWGLEKDLFLPFKQQTKRVQEGEEVLVCLYIDKSSRLCASMNVYECLKTDSPYQKEDKVTGRIYETSPEFGLFVAVDDQYSALIPKREAYGNFQIGDVIEARIISVKEDGRLNLSVREKIPVQIGKDAEKICRLLERYDGVLPFTEKASPEVIKRETQMSKGEFKRAVGHLLKEGKIVILNGVIRKN